MPDLSGATLAVATPVFVRARTTAAYQALRRGGDGAPSPDREFRPTDLIVVRTTVAGADDAPPTVTAEVLTREGKALADASGRHRRRPATRWTCRCGRWRSASTCCASRPRAASTSAMSTAGFAIVR